MADPALDADLSGLTNAISRLADQGQGTHDSLRALSEALKQPSRGGGFAGDQFSEVAINAHRERTRLEASSVQQTVRSGVSQIQAVSQPTASRQVQPPSWEAIKAAALQSMAAGTNPVEAIRNAAPAAPAPRPSTGGIFSAAGGAAPITRAAGPPSAGGPITPAAPPPSAPIPITPAAPPPGGVPITPAIPVAAAAGGGKFDLNRLVDIGVALKANDVLWKTQFTGNAGIGSAMSMRNEGIVQGLNQQADPWSVHNSAVTRIFTGEFGQFGGNAPPVGQEYQSNNALKPEIFKTTGGGLLGWLGWFQDKKPIGS